MKSVRLPLSTVFVSVVDVEDVAGRFVVGVGRVTSSDGSVMGSVVLCFFLGGCDMLLININTLQRYCLRIDFFCSENATRYIFVPGGESQQIDKVWRNNHINTII